VGLLDWNLWDRFDALDRRAGIRREPRHQTDRLRTIRMLAVVWVPTTMMQILVGLGRSDWVWTTVALTVAVSALFTAVWATLQLRGSRLGRAGSPRPPTRHQSPVIPSGDKRLD
jgi:hypothetical protein